MFEFCPFFPVLLTSRQIQMWFTLRKCLSTFSAKKVPEHDVIPDGFRWHYSEKLPSVIVPIEPENPSGADSGCFSAPDPDTWRQCYFRKESRTPAPEVFSGSSVKPPLKKDSIVEYQENRRSLWIGHTWRKTLRFSSGSGQITSLLLRGFSGAGQKPEGFPSKCDQTIRT